MSFETDLVSDPEAQLKRLPRDTRYMIRKGAKAGLETRSGLEQLPEFYELFARNWHRLGTPVLSRSWLEILAQEFQGSAELVMARFNGRPVAGVFSFVFCDTLFPHYSGASPDANTLAASNFIYWELMKSAIGRGIRRFDFGRAGRDPSQAGDAVSLAPGRLWGNGLPGPLARADSDPEFRHASSSPYGVLVLEQLGLSRGPQTILQIANIPESGLHPLDDQ